MSNSVLMIGANINNVYRTLRGNDDFKNLFMTMIYNIIFIPNSISINFLAIEIKIKSHVIVLQ